MPVLERRFDPSQLRDPDGKWGDGVPGPATVLGRLHSSDGLDLEVSAPGDGGATLRFPYPEDAGDQFDAVTLSPESVTKLKSELGDLEPIRKAYVAKVQAAARRTDSADEGTPEYAAANAAWWEIAGDDQIIGAGSAPGAGGGTLHWALTMGEDEPTFSVAIEPPDAGPGWDLAVEASDGTGGHFPASAAPKLRKQLDKVASGGVASRGAQQPRDHDGRWTGGTPGPDLPGMDWAEVHDFYGDEHDEAQAGDFTVAVFEGGDFALFYSNEHGRHEIVRDLDGDYATDLADELDRSADAAEDLNPGDAAGDGLVDYTPLGDGDAYVGHDNSGGVRLLVSKDGGPIQDPHTVPDDGDDQVDVYHLTPDEARQLAEGTRQMLDRYDKLDGIQETLGAARAYSQESGPKYQAPAGPPAGGQFAAGGGRVGAKGKKKPAPRRPAAHGTAKPAAPNPNLSFDGRHGTGTGYGVKGGDPRVRQLQAVLNRLGLADSSGAALVLDGKYGPRTTSSVKKLQKALGVAQDGKVTPELLKQATELKQLPAKPARKPAAKKKTTSTRQAPARRAQLLAHLARALGEEHVIDDGVCVSCWLDRIDELTAALDELTMSRSWDSDAHPRNPKGSPGGGKFRSNVDRLKDALKAHKAGSGTGDPFEGFDREQLRRVAKARGIELKRGEGRDSIAGKLKAHLDDGAAKPAEPRKPAAPAKRAPAKKAPAKKASAKQAPAEKTDLADRSSGTDLIGSDPEALARRVAKDREHHVAADRSLSAIGHEQGFDGKPRVVSKDEMDRLVADGNTEIFRGVKALDDGKTAAEIHQDMRDGHAWYGLGIYGNGYYWGGPDHAAKFADKTPGSTARAVLDPNAKVIEFWGDLYPEHEKFMEQHKGTPDETHINDVYSDPGRYAAARGYDVIKIVPNKGEPWYNVLNRTALVIEEA